MCSSYDRSPSRGAVADDLSFYLDLPPTPLQCHQPNCRAAESPEDMVLPFISRMLMEEDIDDKFFYEYPDHPALLQAQQPFLDILSDDASSSPSAAGSGASVTHPSTSSPNAADAPLHPAAAVDCDAQFNGFDLDPAAFFSGGANSDLMSSAFLKGMEEANRFLPSQDKLVIDPDPPDDAKRFRFLRPAENKQLAASGFDAAAPAAAVAVEVEEAVVAAPGGGVGGRGRKNRFDDDEDDLEMHRRSSKQSALQGDGDVFDKQHMITSQQMCVLVEQMEKLRIPTQEEAAAKKAAAAGGKAKAKGGGGRRVGREVVDLRTLLLHCAQAVATDDRRGATELLKQIERHASAHGDAMQRLARCFAEGLQARLAGTGSSTSTPPLMPKQRTPVVDMLQAYQLYMAAICFKKAFYLFSNQTIHAASLGKKKIHIVDYGIHYGLQWPCFLRRMACRDSGGRAAGGEDHRHQPSPARVPPGPARRGDRAPAQQLRPGVRRAVQVPGARGVEDGDHPRRGSQPGPGGGAHRELHLPVREPDGRERLHGKPEPEGCCAQEHREDAASRVHPWRRERLLQRAVLRDEVPGGSVPLLGPVRRADETTPRDSTRRMLIEENIFGRAALNVIACEGTDRVERPETYRQWQVRNQRAGLKQLPLNPTTVQVVRDKVKGCYHKDFVIDVDRHWLLQGWKGRILYAISTWVANDAAAAAAGSCCF